MTEDTLIVLNPTISLSNVLCLWLGFQLSYRQRKDEDCVLSTFIAEQLAHRAHEIATLINWREMMRRVREKLEN